jgi:pimeloyl-ACP methyl ester carboxylesterase
MQEPTLPGVTHRFVEARGLRFHVAEAGAGEPLLLVHGWPQHWYCFHRVIPSLARRFRVLAVDLRGFGRSDAPAGGYDMPTLADDLAAILDALGHDRVAVMAHDWGGVAAFHLCLRHPHRVSRYVALNTGHPWVTPSRRIARHLWRLYWYQWLMMAPGLNRLAVPRLAAAIGRLCEGYGAWSPEARASYVAQLDDPRRVRATAALYRSFLLRELPGHLARRGRGRRLTVPTLFLHGAADPVIAPQLIDRPVGDPFELRLLRGVGHFTPEEAPERVLEHAIPFLQETR